MLTRGLAAGSSSLLPACDFCGLGQRFALQPNRAAMVGFLARDGNPPADHKLRISFTFRSEAFSPLP